VATTVRIDRLLVERGLVESRERARRLVMAGSVLVGDRPVTKPGTEVAADAEIRLRETAAPFVSRGGEKLAGALDAFALDVAGRVALDVGASTGGFTDCLLQRGARRVIALDVGYGQLAWRLRQDARVVVLERTNARSLAADALPETPDLATVDVSFISLGIVLPAVVAVLAPAADVVALVKPQFEVGKGQVGKGGVVRDDALRAGAVAGVRTAAAALGLEVRGEAESVLPGPKGNREVFLWLSRSRADRSA
jgi:23S rRNA (cytidine1920-2'-O)/16S rRNA (cytidine1409-2'-O)-methyltransferase